MKIVYDPYADALSITFKEGWTKKLLRLLLRLFWMLIQNHDRFTWKLSVRKKSWANPARKKSR